MPMFRGRSWGSARRQACQPGWLCRTIQTVPPQRFHNEISSSLGPWPSPEFTGRKIIVQVKVEHLDNVKFAVHARHHTAICDQPTDNGGSDEGMTPPEFLLASLGSCAMFYAVEYLTNRKLATGGLEVTVDAEKLKPPARLGNFRIEVHCPVPLTEEQQLGLVRSVHRCLIQNTMRSVPEIAIELKVPVLAN